MMSCKQATELMSQEKDRKLGLAERVGLRLHLMMCAGCENYRRQMDVLRTACKRIAGRD